MREFVSKIAQSLKGVLAIRRANLWPVQAGLSFYIRSRNLTDWHLQVRLSATYQLRPLLGRSDPALRIIPVSPPHPIQVRSVWPTNRLTRFFWGLGLG